MTAELGTGMYSARVAARIARVKYQSFQAWAKANLLRGTRILVGARTETVYTYRDLLLIRLVVRLKKEGARTKHVRAALETIELMSGGDPNAWMRSAMAVTSGVVVAWMPERPDWNPIAASRGPQKMAVVFFPELIRELKEELVPSDRFPMVEVDPIVLGGAPVVKGTRITTRAIMSVRDSGEDPRDAYPDLSEEQVRNAEAYEEFLKVA